MVVTDLRDSFYPYPKRERVKDKRLIDDKGHDCEFCGRKNCWTNKHHIKSKGASGDDVEDNLIELCGACHRLVHDGVIEREKLMRIVELRRK